MFPEKVSESDHRVHRGADLMGHVCQKLALGFVGRVRRDPRFFELLRAFAQFLV